MPSDAYLQIAIFKIKGEKLQTRFINRGVTYSGNKIGRIKTKDLKVENRHTKRVRTKMLHHLLAKISR